MSGEVLLQARCAEDHEWDLYGVALPVTEPLDGQWCGVNGIDAIVRLEDLRCPTCQPGQPAVQVTERESLV